MMLAFIEDYILTNSRPPTFRDIQRGVKISSLSMVSHHLDALQEAKQIVTAQIQPSSDVGTSRANNPDGS